MELNVVEPSSRRGYRFAGPAAVHLVGSNEYAAGISRVYREAPPVVPNAVIVLTVERAAPLLSPAYWRGIDETAIRALWRARRATLDQEFEAYLAEVGAVRINGPAT